MQSKATAGISLMLTMTRHAGCTSKSFAKYNESQNNNRKINKDRGKINNTYEFSYENNAHKFHCLKCQHCLITKSLSLSWDRKTLKRIFIWNRYLKIFLLNYWLNNTHQKYVLEFGIRFLAFVKIANNFV